MYGECSPQTRPVILRCKDTLAQVVVDNTRLASELTDAVAGAGEDA